MLTSTRTRLAVLLAIMLMPVSRAEAATISLDPQDVQHLDNLQAIGLALQNYDAVYGRLPAQYVGPSGTPLLSWRVALLPFLGYGALYSQFDLSKAWDDAANLPLLAQMPAMFRGPLDPVSSTSTRYAAGVDPDSVFSGSPGVRLTDIVDAR